MIIITNEMLERMRRQLAIEFPGCCLMCSLHNNDIRKENCAVLGDLSKHKGCPPEDCPLREIQSYYHEVQEE